MCGIIFYKTSYCIKNRTCGWKSTAQSIMGMHSSHYQSGISTRVTEEQFVWEPLPLYGPPSSPNGTVPHRSLCNINQFPTSTQTCLTYYATMFLMKSHISQWIGCQKSTFTVGLIMCVFSPMRTICGSLDQSGIVFLPTVELCRQELTLFKLTILPWGCVSRRIQSNSSDGESSWWLPGRRKAWKNTLKMTI